MTAPTTIDAAHGGRVVLEQPRDGYRFGLDSLLLAAHASSSSPSTVLDVGAGVGVIGLCLADRVAGTHVTFVEREATLAACLERNVARAAAGHEVVRADVLAWPDTRRFEAVVMNPPYYRADEGRINPDPVRAAARHMLHGSVEELVRAAARRVAERGALHVVFPAPGVRAVWRPAVEAGLRHVEFRFVHPTAVRPASTVLVTAAPGRAETLRVAPPLVCYDAEGARSREAEQAWTGT